jgi:uncharacterized membrane protein YdjX (TVP38/TMEM64 family)
MINQMTQWFDEWGMWAIPGSLLLNIVINVIGVVPSVMVTGINVMMWGPLMGGILSWIGEILGSITALWLYRLGIRSFKKMNSKQWRWIESLNRWPRKKQFLSLLAARITPFIPSMIVNLAGAFTNVRMMDFIITTAIGKIPSISLEVLVSYDFLHISENYIRLILILIGMGLVYFVIKVPSKNKSK